MLHKYKCINAITHRVTKRRFKNHKLKFLELSFGSNGVKIHITFYLIHLSLVYKPFFCIPNEGTTFYVSVWELIRSQDAFAPRM